jgi:hypothetical protein
MTLAPPAPLMQLIRAGLVRPLGTLTARPAPMPTGLPALDQLLGGGVPRSATTMLSGGPSSGASMLALQLLASAQRLDGLAVHVDAAQRFDPAAAIQAGLDLTRLLLVRPASTLDALAIAYDLLCEGSAALVLIDSGAAPLPEANLRLLGSAVVRSPSTLVLRTEPSVRVPQADMRLTVSRIGWEANNGDFALRSRVTIAAGKGVSVGRSVDLVLRVDEGAPCWPAS